MPERPSIRLGKITLYMVVYVLSVYWLYFTVFVLEYGVFAVSSGFENELCVFFVFFRVFPRLLYCVHHNCQLTT